MNEDNPILILVIMAIVAYVAVTWASDLRKTKELGEDYKPLPGAVGCRSSVLIWAVIGSLVLLGMETFGELSLGVSVEQSDITWLFGLYTLFAAFGEELIFRGFLFYDKGSKAAMIGSCVAISLVFALLHGYVIGWEEGGFTLDLGLKGLFSTAFLFVGSLWFYWLRFSELNLNRSLIPCIVAHATKNVGVVAIKAIQGHVIGLY